MHRISLVAAVALIMAFGPQGVRAQDTAQIERLFASAERKAVIDGDLRGAIEDYKTIVARAGTNHAVAARAALAIGDTYRQLGDLQGREWFQKIIRDYPDQSRFVSEARARLNVSGSTRAKVSRQLWTGPEVNQAGTVSSDGRFVTFVDPETNDLAIHDLTTGGNVRLTSAQKTGFAERSAISRDGSQVAYTWFVNSTNRYELRLISASANSAAAPRVLIDNPEITYVTPFDWTPDGQWIAAQIKRKDRTAQIGLINVRDGALTPLRSIDWRGVTTLSVSPNGKFIAYDLPITESGMQRDILVLSRDGRRPETSVRPSPGYNTVVGWSPAGDSLLFASERAGMMGLWTVRMADGTPQGSPTLLDSDLGTFDGTVGITRSGSLMFHKKVGVINVYTAAVDLWKRTVSVPEPIAGSYVFNQIAPSWSPDGSALAYTLQGRGVNTVMIRSMATGQTREVTPRMSSFAFARWSAQGFMTFQGADLKGRYGIYRMDVATGDVSPIVVGGNYLAFASATRDGKYIVYTSNNGNDDFSLRVRNLASGDDRELAHSVATATEISPDGRLVAYRTGTNTSAAIMVVPIEGGVARELLKTDRMNLAHFVEWLQDSRRVLATKVEDGKATSFLLSVDGADPVEVALPGGHVGPFLRLHPDEHRVAYSGGRPTWELWVLENFLPAPASSKR